MDQLNAAGFTAQKYGQEEYDRRISLLTGIDEADSRLEQRKLHATPGVVGARMRDKGIYGSLTTDAAALETARKDVLNPTISVSNIKVPGMPALMQPGVANPAGGGYGGFGPMVFGGGSGTNPRPFAAPATNVGTPPPSTVTPPSPSNPAPQPTTVTPPPAVVKPPPMPSPTTTPGYWASEKNYTPPKPKVNISPWTLNGPR